MRHAAAVALVAALAAGAGAAPPAAPAPANELGFRTGGLTAGARRGVAAGAWQGGRFTTASGDAVTVFASATYPGAETVARRWAEFFSGLVHGPELGLVTAYVAPPAEVQELCRNTDVLGCYGDGTLVTIGEQVGEVAPEEVAAHEYGHHVAANRRNDPWSAVDWGAKRWASAVGVCERERAGTAFPGDEGLHYTSNPGEAFAEAFRVLNGEAPAVWSVVGPSFRPDATALEALREDVLHPWAQAPPRVLRGRVTRARRTWVTPLRTPLDGELTVTQRPGSRAVGTQLALLSSTGRVLARGAWTSTGAKTLTYLVCGTRNVRLRVTGDGAAQTFQLSLSIP